MWHGGALNSAAIKELLAGWPIEGIVWWRDNQDPHCDKVKIKARDFGLPWPRDGATFS